jgi:hypothetical protein
MKTFPCKNEGFKLGKNKDLLKVIDMSLLQKGN